MCHHAFTLSLSKGLNAKMRGPFDRLRVKCRDGGSSHLSDNLAGKIFRAAKG